MYQELNKQFLISELDFNQSKTLTLINIQCTVCENIFQQTKHQIKTNYKRSISKIFYCSSKCLAESKATKQTLQCGECKAEIIRLPKEIKKSKSGHSFCNASCAATYNNKARDKEIYLKQSETLKLKYANGELKLTGAAAQKSQIMGPFFSKQNCIICSKEFLSKRYKKTCSEECFKEVMHRIHINNPHVILNRSNPESYLEKSFREFIENNKYIKNENFFQDKWFKINDKIYFADFYFPELNLIIELDR